MTLRPTGVGPRIHLPDTRSYRRWTSKSALRRPKIAIPADDSEALSWDRVDVSLKGRIEEQR